MYCDLGKQLLTLAKSRGSYVRGYGIWNNKSNSELLSAIQKYI